MRTMTRLAPLVLAALVLAALALLVPIDDARGEGRRKVLIRSTLDDTEQTSYVTEPAGLDPSRPTPLLVSLHTWSSDVEQRREDLEQLALDRGWIVLQPNFRGRNDHPEACGSRLAQQDILDAVAWARRTLPVDAKRIYLTGVSGGGHMTMLMAGRHPELWAAASAWVGISDLAAWHAKHATDNYGAMMRASCGGAPGGSPEIDREYRERSPLTYLAAARDLPLDIAAGVHDGHTGSVPIRHSLDAFNRIAVARGDTPIRDEEIEQLSRRDGRLAEPRDSDRVEDSTFGRTIYLRRQTGAARVTIFEGGHEGISNAAIAWLEQHAK